MLLKDKILKQKQVFTLGSDPEMFAFSGNKLLPAFEFLPRKEEANIFWDGFQAEWTTSPTEHLNLLVEDMRKQLKQFEKQIKTYNLNGKISLRNVVRISRKTLESAQQEHVDLGCKPSYNAYGMRGKVVSEVRELLARFSGGHKHFGEWDKPPDYELYVKTWDAILGIWSVGAAQNIDSPIRREYYGLAGEYRMPVYARNKDGKAIKFGIEYRTLSNFWLCHPAIMQLSWEIARQAAHLANNKYRKFWVATEDEIINAINGCDVKLAARILKRNKPMFEWMMKQIFPEDKVIEALGVSFNGIESIIKDPNDVTRNWQL